MIPSHRSVTLPQVALDSGAEPVVLAEMMFVLTLLAVRSHAPTLSLAMPATRFPRSLVRSFARPRHWSDFVRNAPLENVSPLGLK